MKVRSVKLREAHKAASSSNGRGGGSFCSVVWDQQAHHLVTASSSDPSISIHDPLLQSSAPRILRHHRDGVTAIAISPNSTCLASGSIDHSVKLYKFPGGEFETNITRFTLPIRALAFNRSGSMLAAAGDDEGIKLINTIDGSIARVLKGHKGPVTGLAFDPKSEYLASVDSTGTVIFWELQSGVALHTLKGVAPDIGLDLSVMNVISWSPDGETLAVPGLRNDVVMYDRDTAEKLFTLRGDHIQPICFLSWSPNEEEDLSASGSLSDLGEGSHGESEPPSRKRLRKPSAYEENLEENGNDEWSLRPKVESRKKANRIEKESLNNRNEGLRSITSARPKMQESFQPGATPVQPGKRSFLCYNMVGSITTIEHDGYSHIEIDFHDTGSGPRVPSMTDHFGFTMAALNENGSVFANPCKGEKSMSTLMYRPFSTWANNSEWSMRLEGEEVKAVALGTAWVAAITSFNFLRIFSESGLQRHILSLNGPVVTASGFKDELAIVTHACDCLPSNDQMLEFTVFNISTGTQSLKGRLPLTPGSHLAWFGFSEEGQLSSYDSKGVLRVYTSQYGGSWLPLFSASKEKSDENYWVVGLNASKLFCIVCKKPDLFPQVMPKPVLTLLNLSFPVASSDLGAEALENEFILNNMHLLQIQKRMEEMAGAGLDTTSLDDEAFNTEAAQDRCILRLIASCCNGDKLVRAIELVKLLSLEKSVKGAIKLVTALKLPNLAERFNSVLEERLINEATGMKQTTRPSSSGDAPVVANVSVSKSLVSSETSKTSETVISSSSPKLTAPLFTKKAKSQEGAKGGIKKTEQNQTTLLDDIDKEQKVDEVKNAGEARKIGEMSQIQTDRPSNQFIKSSNKQEVKKVGENQVQSHRPSNPFLKSSVK
ncbi:wd repeat and hmg-box dna-binding protein 1 [Quercus suber]|uniref:Wd repeat and hmg-box dna-binding protein 1 n=1 Tax=Quercus suber TaxID=58331 RepID=A0AAW0L296_QUESU